MTERSGLWTSIPFPTQGICEHGPTTVGLSGHKSIPLYNSNMEAYRFCYDVVYTNVQAAGAYRGYGATQEFLQWKYRQ